VVLVAYAGPVSHAAWYVYVSECVHRLHTQKKHTHTHAHTHTPLESYLSLCRSKHTHTHTHTHMKHTHTHTHRRRRRLLLAVLRKRGLDLLVRGEVNGGAAVLVLEQWIGAEIKQLRYCARQPVGACHMQRRANCWAVGLVALVTPNT